MPNRLPLELELTILELAAPPLSVDHLHDRVDFFINASLVHRSLTAWAQERLHDQFLYTYHQRADEHERLKKRFEAGFGANRQLRRLYLDLTGLPKDIDERTKPGADSVSATIDGRVYGAVSLPSGPSPAEAGTSAQEQACDAVAHFRQYEDHSNIVYWSVCAMIATHSEALDTLWLKPPLHDLNIEDLHPPRVLYVDDDAFDDPWTGFGLIPASSTTVLYLRNVSLCGDEDDGYLSTRQLVFGKCEALEASVGDMLDVCPHIEILVLFDTKEHNLLLTVYSLPASIRHVHILQHAFHDNVDHYRHYPWRVLPQLESFTFELLLPSTGTPTDNDRNALAQLQQAVESILDAPRCTFKNVRSTKSPEGALADALAKLGLDSS